MNSVKTHYEKTSADSKEIGFDFQYLCFISKLLDLNINQKITYEEKDDIHIESPNGELTLIQVKHSIQTNIDGETKNLTELDTDLWKTLHNWTQIIIDPNDGRKNKKEQLEFLKNTKFVLLTNKNIATNPVLLKIKNFKDKCIKPNEFKKYLEDLKSTTTNLEIVKHIETISKLDKNVFNSFIDSISTEQAKTSIIEEIKQKIKNKMIKDTRIIDVFCAIYAKLKVDFFEKVHKGEKQSISYDQFLKEYTPIFENFKTTFLPYRIFNPVLPENLQEQFFLQELVEIGDIGVNDIEEMADYTESMLNLKMNLDKWYEDNELTQDEIKRFHENAYLIWKNSHKEHHINSILDNDNQEACSCLFDLRKKILKVKQTELEVSPSNGEFYYLANEKEIGWKKYWQTKYKK